MAMFSGAIFNSAVFNTGSVTPPAPAPTIPPNLQAGAGGLISPHLTDLARTHSMPGMRKMIEAEDERVLQVLIEAVTKGRLH